MPREILKPGLTESSFKNVEISGNDLRGDSLTIGLYDPGMTSLHRVGLAGLYMALKSQNQEDFKIGSWQLSPSHIKITWSENPKQFLNQLIKSSFLIRNGMIHFLPYKDSTIDDHGRILLHTIILQTFLQHNQKRDEIAGKETLLTLQFENKQVIYKIKMLNGYNHQDLQKSGLFDHRGHLAGEGNIDGWLYPGASVRHWKYKKETTISQEIEKILCLLFAPIAALYYSISHRSHDGKRDKRKIAAIVLPHINDLQLYDRAYKRYLRSPVQRLYADSLGDAGLMALSALNIFDPAGKIQQMGIDSCSVIMMGSVGWSKQQKTRTGIAHFRHIDKNRLNQFALALSLLDNHAHVTEGGGFYVLPSMCRGLIAENIASGKEWFLNFTSLMKSKTLAAIVSTERKGLNAMVKNIEWSNEADKLFVEALHTAIRNRYGALAERVKQRGGYLDFGKEFEKIRSSLMRSKNAQTCRAALADLFARGKTNQTLKDKWQSVLPLFTGPDWQRSRDLALLALASYAGKATDDTKNDE